MASQQADIVTIQQPIDLLAAQGHQLVGRAWPLESFFRQGLVIEDKAVVFPHQTLDFVALAISEGIQRTAKRVESERLFDQQRQAIGLLAKINGLTIQVNLGHRPRRPQIARRHGSCLRIAPSKSRLLACRPLMVIPPGRVSVSSLETDSDAGPSRVTRAKPVVGRCSASGAAATASNLRRQ